MNWLNFFFGWLTKGQYEVSMIDEVMFFIELMVVVILFYTIKDFIEERRKKKKASDK